MPEKDPTTYSMLTYAWVLLLAGWGGVVGYLRKVKTGVTDRFSFAELIGEITTSAFTGILAFWLCEAAQINDLITAAIVGVSGHMGSRGIFIIERMLQNRIGVSEGKSKRD